MSLRVECYNGESATLHEEELRAINLEGTIYLIEFDEVVVPNPQFEHAYQVVRTDGNGALVERVTNRTILSKLEKFVKNKN